MTDTPRIRQQKRLTLRWEITGILVFKLAIILLAGFTIFDPHHRVHVDTDLMSGKLLSSAVPAVSQESR